MFDWFWNLPPMQAVQNWVDASRGLVDPLWLIVFVVAAALGVVAWMAAPAAVKDRKGMGHHYKGAIAPKTLGAMLAPPRPKRARTRAQMEKALQKAREARARREAGGEEPEPLTWVTAPEEDPEFDGYWDDRKDR